MKKLFIACLLCVAVASVCAKPARRTMTRYTKADGTTVNAIRVADEWGEYYLDAQSGKRLSPAAQAPAQLTQAAPSMGAHNLPLLLVEFSDVKFTDLYTQGGYDSKLALFDDMCNGANYTFQGASGSAKRYFNDQSYNQYDPTFDVVGPVCLSQAEAYYGENSGTYRDIHIREAIAEAIDSACTKGIMTPEMVQNWDNDGDGYVDLIFVVFAGYSEAEGADATCIWPKKWSISAKRPFAGKPAFSTFACGTELVGVGEAGEELSIDGIGTICHEFGHALGLPDLYVTNGTNGYGMDYWDIMDVGCYNGSGKVPASYTAYERIQLGWLAADTLTLADSISVTLPAITSQPKAYVYLSPSNPNEGIYFENHQRQSWDTYMGGCNKSYVHGMMMVHVDYNASAWYANTVNNDASHQRYTLLPADGKLDAYSAMSNTSDANQYYGWLASFRSDLWPSAGAGTTLSSKYPDYKVTGPYRELSKESGNPYAAFFSGDDFNIVIENITESNGVITFSVKPYGYVNPVSIESIKSNETGSQARKVMIDGQLYIVNNGKLYTISGQQR